MQKTLFDVDFKKSVEDISNPDSYKGIYSFHKYWGKKPTESIIYFIQQFTNKYDLVLDPFLGSGLISRECLIRDRRFIGIDINPFSIEHTKFLLNLPKAEDYFNAFKNLELLLKNIINISYSTESNKIASHYLWEGKILKKVWLKPENSRNRIELNPTQIDIDKINSFSKYEINVLRNMKFFTNSRINTITNMTISDLFTNRALYNIELLLNEILKYPDNIRRALLLTLTASSGQMSNMVFAISNRGKTKNIKSDKIEVGSWVIGFWRPELHFEINVWNCFESRAMKLYKALKNIENFSFIIFNSINELMNQNTGASIINGDCLEIMKKIPDKSIKLICTDPPHSDRIPYLELSEMWNSILNTNVNFEKEIIVSNAKERNKKKQEYLESMKKLIVESNRILKDDGIILLFFNARDKESWKFFEIIKNYENLNFIGSFPMEYSATSVVQDNRKGGMKTDYVLVIKKGDIINKFQHELDKIPGWSVQLPKLEK